MEIIEDRVSEEGLPCPYEDGHEDVQQCTRGACAEDLCEDMNCVREADDYPCQERVGLCVDVSDLYDGLRKAECQYVNKPDGTTCPDGECLEGECMYVVPAEDDNAEDDNASVDPATDSDDPINYEHAFYIMAGVTALLLILSCALYCCKSKEKEEVSKDVEVEMGESKRVPNIIVAEGERLPVMASPSTGGASYDGDARLAIQTAGLPDNDTNMTQYDDIDFTGNTGV